MKKWRIVYWFGSIMTETFVKADCKEIAIVEFEKKIGKNEEWIINIEEVS